MIINIQVTQSDIDHGHRYECRRCPIALAVKRAVRARSLRFHIVQASPSGVYVGGTRPMHAPLANAAATFIFSYDYFGQAKPTEFLLHFDL